MVSNREISRHRKLELTVEQGGQLSFSSLALAEDVSSKKDESNGLLCTDLGKLVDCLLELTLNGPGNESIMSESFNEVGDGVHTCWRSPSRQSQLLFFSSRGQESEDSRVAVRECRAAPSIPRKRVYAASRM